MRDIFCCELMTALYQVPDLYYTKSSWKYLDDTKNYVYSIGKLLEMSL